MKAQRCGAAEGAWSLCVEEVVKTEVLEIREQEPLLARYKF
jgi:hypothetical protein